MANCARVTHGAYVSVHIPTYPIPRAQPAHHFVRATGVVRRPKAGRRGRRPLRAVCLLYVAAYNVRAQSAHHFLRAQSRYPSSHAGRAWKPAPTAYLHLTHAGTNPSVTPQCGATAPLSGEPMEWVRRTHVIRSPTPGGLPRPPLRVFLPAFFDVHPLSPPLGLYKRLARLVRRPASRASSASVTRLKR